MKTIITATIITFLALGTLLGQGFKNNGASINITKNTTVYVDGTNGNFNNVYGGNVNLSGALTLKGSFINDGDFVIQDSASLLDNGNVTGSGNTLLKKHILNTGSHFIASPMQGLVVEDVFNGFFVNKYDEPSSTWIALQTGDPLSTPNGFSVLHPQEQLVEYFGNLNSGDYSVSITTTGGGWNLVGNPYPSAMVWDSVYEISTNINTAIYYYNPTISNYSYYVLGGGSGPGQGVNNGTNIIPATQGFFVFADYNGTFMTSNNARGHFNQPFYKKEQPEMTNEFIRLSVSSAGYEDELLVRIGKDAGLLYDSHCDAKKLFSFKEEVPHIFAVAGEDNLAIQTFSLAGNSTIIPLGFKTAGEGDFTINFKELTVDAATYVYLEDKLFNSFMDLREVPSYDFHTVEAYNTSRFALHFTSLPVDIGDDPENAHNISLYVNGNEVFIQTDKPTMLTNAVLNIYHIDGKIASTHPLMPSDLQKVSLNLVKGIYVARVVSSSNLITKKISLN